jgi:HD-like signal output (HDOD) protein
MSAKPKKILFVDDEPNILQSLKRGLRSMQYKWDMYFVLNGNDAISLMEEQNFDVILTKIILPDMPDNQLLKIVSEKYPNVARVILSGCTDQKIILKSLKYSHQFLAKPSNEKLIITAITKACVICDLLNDINLKKIVSGTLSLPSLPSLYHKINQEILSDNSSIQRIGTIISKDIGMSSKILQIVNSSYFGLPQKVSTIQDAVMFLGLDTIHALVISSDLFFEVDTTFFPISFFENMQNHSIGTGMFARKIAKIKKCEKRICDYAFLAGVLHDVGKLVIISNWPEKYKEILKKAEKDKLKIIDVEKEILGTTHCNIGAYLMSLWGMNSFIVEAIAFHHYPNQIDTEQFSILSSVHVANVFEHVLKGNKKKSAVDKIDLSYLTKIHCDNQISEWYTACKSNVINKE